MFELLERVEPDNQSVELAAWNQSSKLSEAVAVRWRRYQPESDGVEDAPVVNIDVRREHTGHLPCGTNSGSRSRSRTYRSNQFLVA